MTENLLNEEFQCGVCGESSIRLDRVKFHPCLMNFPAVAIAEGKKLTGVITGSTATSVVSETERSTTSPDFPAPAVAQHTPGNCSSAQEPVLQRKNLGRRKQLYSSKTPAKASGTLRQPKLHWPNYMVYNLLFIEQDIINERNPGQGKIKKSMLYRQISQQLLGKYKFQASSEQVCTKLKDLKITYNGHIDDIIATGGGPPPKWEFFELMFSIHGTKSNIRPHTVVSNMEGFVTIRGLNVQPTPALQSSQVMRSSIEHTGSTSMPQPEPEVTASTSTSRAAFRQVPYSSCDIIERRGRFRGSTSNTNKISNKEYIRQQIEEMKEEKKANIKFKEEMLSLLKKIVEK